eukprot:COSAG01_NODE_33438_length_564_cov_0.774194_1_plen_20_part_10
MGSGDGIRAYDESMPTMQDC